MGLSSLPVRELRGKTTSQLIAAEKSSAANRSRISNGRKTVIGGGNTLTQRENTQRKHTHITSAQRKGPCAKESGGTRKQKNPVSSSGLGF